MFYLVIPVIVCVIVLLLIRSIVFYETGSEVDATGSEVDADR